MSHLPTRPAPVVLAALLLSGACIPDAPLPRGFDPREAPLVFSSDRDGVSRVYLRPAGADRWRPLTPRTLGSSWPVPSPDGRRILFQAVRDGSLDVHVVDVAGGVPLRLTRASAHEYLPAWAPGGTITFTSRVHAPEADRLDAWLWIMDADGTGQRRLVEEGLGTSSPVAWAPDGATFLARRVTDEGEALWRGAADGTWIEPVGPDLRSPAFSPDGAWIAAAVDDGEGSRIDVLRPDGSGRHTVLSGGRHHYPRWSPDGRWLLTCSAVDDAGDDLDVLFLPADGSAPAETLVGGPGRECEASWLPGERAHGDLASTEPRG